MRIAITGATGNLGTSVIEALTLEPRVSQIIGIARRLPKARFPRTEFRQADVAESDLVAHFAGMDAVVHLAWQIQPSHRSERLERTNIAGSQRVFDAVVSAGVPTLLYASSVGAYSPAPKDRLVDESWPTDGVDTAHYSRQKARVEHMLDELESRHPRIRVVRMRPALVFKRAAATGIRRLFVGPLLPRFVLGDRLRFVPDHRDFRFQAVHSFDVGRAFRAAAVSDAHGPFNLAAPPLLDSDSLALAFDATKIKVTRDMLRRLTKVAWWLHVQRSEPGWIDLCFESPLMSAERARQELGWVPRHTSLQALSELLQGMRRGSGLRTPPLAPPFETSAAQR